MLQVFVIAADTERAFGGPCVAIGSPYVNLGQVRRGRNRGLDGRNGKAVAASLVGAAESAP